MVLDDRIDVEADLIGMLHLPQHLGVELGVRLVRGILQLGVQSEVHERSLAGAEPAGLEDSPRGLEGAALFYGAQGLFLLRQVRRLAIVELRRLFPGTASTLHWPTKVVLMVIVLAERPGIASSQP